VTGVVVLILWLMDWIAVGEVAHRLLVWGHMDCWYRVTVVAIIISSAISESLTNRQVSLSKSELSASGTKASAGLEPPFRVHFYIY